MSIDAMYQKLADSELAKTLTADDQQHERGDKDFVPPPLKPSMSIFTPPQFIGVKGEG